jgi:hypothetical protein
VGRPRGIAPKQAKPTLPPMAIDTVPLPPASPVRPRRRWLLALGWLLTLPGLWVIASMILLDTVSRWAGCPSPVGLRFPPCPQGSAGGLADAMRQSVALTMIASFIGIGVIPPFYSAVFISLRLARRLGRWFARPRQGDVDVAEPTPGRVWVLGFALFLGLIMLAGFLHAILATARAPSALADLGSGALGLVSVIAIIYGGLRLFRWIVDRAKGKA